MNYEEKMKRLSEIVQALEQGQLSLEESVMLYHEGAALSEECRTELEKAVLEVRAHEVPAEGGNEQ